jgi:uncharacterized protein YidB (DUF937 family)
MGLMDILRGMENGPRGASTPAPSGGAQNSGGMSPITIALLGLLAYKAVKHFSGGQTAPAAPSGGGEAPTIPASSGGGLGGWLGGSGGLGGLLGGSGGGGLGDLMKGPLGGLLAGGAAGSVVSGGLSDILKQFEQKGHGEAVQSWVGDGPNKTISPTDLSNVLDDDQINALSEHSGLSRDELLSGLSQQLPELVHRLTPQGRVPTEDEANQMG